MKKILVSIVILVALGNRSYGQTFNNFISLFPQITETDNILNITSNQTDDFLNRSEISYSLYNEVLFNYTEKPYYRDLNNQKVNVDYIAEQDNDGVDYIEYDDEGNETETGVFNDKIVAIGQIELLPSSSFKTVIVAIRNLDIVYLHLYNFDNNHHFLSSVRLVELQATRNNIYYENPAYDFNIESDGKIYQEYDGLDFYRERKYELQADGHFKVIWENVVDK